MGGRGGASEPELRGGPTAAKLQREANRETNPASSGFFARVKEFFYPGKGGCGK